MKYVEHDSGGKVRLGPGTLYGAIKRLLEMGYIKESGQRPDPKHDDERRRYYKITGKGLKILTSELKRYEEALELARKNNVMVPKPVFIGI
jgi:DNA-binding PadR family transcriptional regulator